jgi:hypothetical protein
MTPAGWACQQGLQRKGGRAALGGLLPELQLNRVHGIG